MKRKKTLSIIMTFFMLFTNVVNPQLIQTIFAEAEKEETIEPTAEVDEDETTEDDESEDPDADVHTESNEDDGDDGADSKQTDDQEEESEDKTKDETPANEDETGADKETKDNKGPPVQADDGDEEETIQTLASESKKSQKILLMKLYLSEKMVQAIRKEINLIRMKI